jgi:hypothetical protein
MEIMQFKLDLKLVEGGDVGTILTLISFLKFVIISLC